MFLFPQTRTIPGHGGHAGFTLVEVLLVVGMLAIMGGVAIVAVGNTREATRVSKLQSDVATINAAIQAYRINGGSTLAVDATPDDILQHLKAFASDATASTIPGLRGSFVDRRLTTDPQTAAEAASSQPRALWNGVRFVVASSGPVGVKNFLLDDAAAGAAVQKEDRTPMLKTQDNGWVWAYVEPTPAASGLGTGPSGGPPPATADNGNDPVVPTPSQLLPPIFDPAADRQRLALFDPALDVRITNPNGRGDSQIYYSTGGPEFVLYQDGQVLSATPGMHIDAYAMTSVPDKWVNSPSAAITYNPIPVTLSLAFNSVTAPTYAQAGGQMSSGAVQTPPAATVSLQTSDTVPSRYLASANFEVTYSYDGTDPLASANKGPAFNGAFASPSIPLNYEKWGASRTLTLKAAPRILNDAYFASGGVASLSVGITSTLLAAPTIDPPQGAKALDLPVSILLPTASVYPVGARIFYTTDGNDPGDNGGGGPATGTLYAGQFYPGAGTNGVLTITARLYGPEGAAQWFTPSPKATATYSIVTLPDGALVGSASLNGTFVGSLVYAPPANGAMSSISFNSGAKIVGGNLYLPGTPTIRLSSGTTWSAQNDSAFSGYIQGWEYNSSGAKTVQTTPRVIDENGSTSPSGYTVSFQSGSLLEGKVIRRHNAPAFPTIPAPPAPDSNGARTYDSPPPGPVSASTYSSITLGSNAGDVRLNAGHYATLLGNGGNPGPAFVLGDPDHPDVTQVYSFQGLGLNNGTDIKVVGKAIVTIAGNVNLDNGSVIGNPDHPEWLQLQFSSGGMNAHPGSKIYAQLVAPNGDIKFDSGAVFVGSVTARSLDVSGNGVVFDLPPIIAN